MSSVALYFFNNDSEFLNSPNVSFKKRILSKKHLLPNFKAFKSHVLAEPSMPRWPLYMETQESLEIHGNFSAHRKEH